MGSAESIAKSEAHTSANMGGGSVNNKSACSELLEATGSLLDNEAAAASVESDAAVARTVSGESETCAYVEVDATPGSCGILRMASTATGSVYSDDAVDGSSEKAMEVARMEPPNRRAKAEPGTSTDAMISLDAGAMRKEPSEGIRPPTGGNPSGDTLQHHAVAASKVAVQSRAKSEIDTPTRVNNESLFSGCEGRAEPSDATSCSSGSNVADATVQRPVQSIAASETDTSTNLGGKLAGETSISMEVSGASSSWFGGGGDAGDDSATRNAAVACMVPAGSGIKSETVSSTNDSAGSADVGSMRAEPVKATGSLSGDKGLDLLAGRDALAAGMGSAESIAKSEVYTSANRGGSSVNDKSGCSELLKATGSLLDDDAAVVSVVRDAIAAQTVLAQSNDRPEVEVSADVDAGSAKVGSMCMELSETSDTTLRGHATDRSAGGDAAAPWTPPAENSIESGTDIPINTALSSADRTTPCMMSLGISAASPGSDADDVMMASQSSSKSLHGASSMLPPASTSEMATPRRGTDWFHLPLNDKDSDSSRSSSVARLEDADRRRALLDDLHKWVNPELNVPSRMSTAPAFSAIELPTRDCLAAKHAQPQADVLLRSTRSCSGSTPPAAIAQPPPMHHQRHPSTQKQVRTVATSQSAGASGVFALPLSPVLSSSTVRAALHGTWPRQQALVPQVRLPQQMPSGISSALPSPSTAATATPRFAARTPRANFAFRAPLANSAGSPPTNAMPASPGSPRANFAGGTPTRNVAEAAPSMHTSPGSLQANLAVGLPTRNSADAAPVMPTSPGSPRANLAVGIPTRNVAEAAPVMPTSPGSPRTNSAAGAHIGSISAAVPAVPASPRQDLGPSTGHPTRCNPPTPRMPTLASPAQASRRATISGPVPLRTLVSGSMTPTAPQSPTCATAPSSPSVSPRRRMVFV